MSFLGIESFLVIATLLTALIAASALSYLGVKKLFITEPREYELLTGLTITLLIAVIGALAVLASGPGVTTVYIFGIFVGVATMYFGTKYYLVHHDKQITSIEELEDGDDEDSREIPAFYQNIGNANQHTASHDPSPDSRDRDGRFRKRAFAGVETTAAAIGGTLGFLIGTAPEAAFPAFAIGAGAVVTAMLLFITDGRTYYAGGGTLYCLFTAGYIQLVSLPEAYTKSPFAVLLTLGAISAAVVAVQLGVGLILQRLLSGVTGEETALRIYDAVAAVLGLLAMIWAVINIHERATRYGGVTIGGTLGMVLNFLGIELPIPWIISDGVDASMVLFIGAVLIGFHTLESLHTTWHATKQTAKSGAAAGKVAGRKSLDAASTAREKFKDE